MKIKLWLKIKQVHPVWYFDATFNVMTNVNGISPLLFSIVCHDPIKNILFPVYEFAACSLSTVTIMRYLLFLKKTLENLAHNDDFKIAPIIVTDEAWSHINALCETFNYMTMVQYMEVSYQIVFNAMKTDQDKASQICYKNSLKCVVYLCSTHYLKNIIKEVELGVRDKVRRVFIFCFTLLQNSVSIEEFLDHLDKVYYLFNQPFKNQST